MVAVSVSYSSYFDRYFLYAFCCKELVKKNEGIEKLWLQGGKKAKWLVKLLKVIVVVYLLLILYQLLKRANSKKDYNGIAEEIYRLRDLKQNALVASAEREGLKKRIAEMREFLDSQPTEVLEYDEQLVRRLIEKITVYDERFEVEFKSGMAVDVER